MKRRLVCRYILVAALWAMMGMSPALPGHDKEHVKQIVLIAGIKSHGPGEHEYLKSAELLALPLNRAPNLKQIKATAYFNGWPDDPSVLDHADTIAFLSDGDDGTEPTASHAPFTTDERMQKLAKQMDRGCGLVTSHFPSLWLVGMRRNFSIGPGGYFDWQGGYGEGGFFGFKDDAAHELKSTSFPQSTRSRAAFHHSTLPRNFTIS